MLVFFQLAPESQISGKNIIFYLNTYSVYRIQELNKKRNHFLTTFKKEVGTGLLLRQVLWSIDPGFIGLSELFRQMLGFLKICFDLIF